MIWAIWRLFAKILETQLIVIVRSSSMERLFYYDAKLLHFLQDLLADVVHYVPNYFGHYLFEVFWRGLNLDLLEQPEEALAFETRKLVPVIQ